MPLTDDLTQQHLLALDMLDRVVDACDDDAWQEELCGAAFWREAYHALFWLRLFAQGTAGTFDMMPFGKDVDPRLFTPPNHSVSREEFRGFSAACRAHLAGVFAGLSPDDWDAPDTVENEGTVGRRILYGLRHVQHHVGRLTARLNARGVNVEGPFG